MHGNLLSSLPSNLGQLASLRTLQLVGNRLQAVPESISALKQLSDLGLAGNQLTAAPAALGNLSELAAMVSHAAVRHSPAFVSQVMHNNRRALQAAKPPPTVAK